MNRAMLNGAGTHLEQGTPRVSRASRVSME
jgi:hypothetical protein